ncbi:MAG: DUF3606 domain-containing protein [Sphingobacteriales bacterium]|jgi:hypothetical protein|nr:MAG: DUF3606 domain-containing protein [Sphingobacteriales bacterium]
MSDDLNKKGSQDSSRINTNEPHEVSYWASKFGVTKQELKRAIDKVGSSAASVEKELNNK